MLAPRRAAALGSGKHCARGASLLGRGDEYNPRHERGLGPVPGQM